MRPADASSAPTLLPLFLEALQVLLDVGRQLLTKHRAHRVAGRGGEVPRSRALGTRDYQSTPGRPQGGGMDRDAAHAALRRRLAETHLRAEIYKDQTLQLHREGVSTQDPRFVGAFMAAKAAHLELEARLKSRARLEMMRQRATCVKIRVEEQAARRDFLTAHRRYLDPALGERLDAVDDRLADQEEQLEEAATNASLWETATWPKDG